MQILCGSLAGALLLVAPLASQSLLRFSSGVPRPPVTQPVQIATHTGGLNQFHTVNLGFPIGRFNPVIGTLTGIEIEFSLTTDYSQVGFAVGAPSNVARNLSLNAETRVVFDRPEFQVGLDSSHALRAVIQPQQRTQTYSLGQMVDGPVTIRVPPSMFRGFLGLGALQVDMLCSHTYSGSFAGTPTVTWRPEVSGQMQITYEFEPHPDGYSERGLPGHGFSSVAFDVSSPTEYLVGANVIFDPTFRDGEDLGLGDDEFADRPLLFPFQMPDGRLITDLRIDSNGYVSDPADGLASEYSASTADFLQLGTRIAACWSDFSPNQGGSVWFRADDRRAVITWYQVPEFGIANANTFQLQLFRNGRIWLLYADMELVRAPVIVGCSEGNLTFPVTSTDLSAVAFSPPAPFPRTVFEQFNAAPDLNTDPTMPVLAAATAPRLGWDYTLELQNRGAGFAETLIIGLPGSLDLGFVLGPNTGLNGWYIRIDLSSLQDAPFMNTFTTPVPVDLSLIGGQVEFQCVTLDSSVVNPLQLNFSNALTAVIGT